MRYDVHVPGPPLFALVDYLWALSDVPAHARERIVPSGTQELVINLHEDGFAIFDGVEPRFKRYRGAIVSGAYRRSFLIDTSAHASVIGVHFRPGGAQPVLGAAPGELADQHVDLEALWGRDAGVLRERLVAARDTHARFRILETALAARLDRGTHRHPAVRVAVESLALGGCSVGDVAAHVRLSRRRLIELFTAEVGMTPKLFSRVQRFQRAFGTIEQQGACHWAQIALDCGYFDQSHMIRDFVAFAGATPGEVARHLGPPLKGNHLAVAGDETI